MLFLRGSLGLIGAEAAGWSFGCLACVVLTCPETLGAGCVACVTACGVTLVALPSISLPAVKKCANLVRDYSTEYGSPCK